MIRKEKNPTALKKGNWLFGISFLLPGLVFLAIMARYGVYPFGSRSLLISDLDSQYIEFMAEFQRALKSGDGFLYSWNAGMGLNFPGLIAYYLSSPFNLLTIFFPEDRLIDAISLIITLKLCCCGLSFSFYLYKRFGERTLLIPAFGLYYALCGYAIAYSFNLMWLDALIILPVLCVMIDNIIARGKWIGCALTFGWLFISNYYIGYMVALFSCLYFLLRHFTNATLAPDAHTQRPIFLKSAFLFAISAGIGAGLGAFLLVPEFFVLKDNMGLIGQKAPIFSAQFNLLELPRKLFIGSFDGVKDCLPHIFCGIIPIVFVPFYFFSKQVSLKEKIGAGLLIGFLVISLWLKPLDFIWHACDYPSWFPYRYAFLLSFVLLSIGYESLLCYSKKTDAKQKSVLFIAIICLAIFLILSMGRDISIPKLALAANGVAFVCIFLALSSDMLSKKWAPGCILICAILETAINGGVNIGFYAPKYTLRADYISFTNAHKQKLAGVLPNENEFYRIEKEKIRVYNDPMAINMPGISHFSSTASTRQSKFLKRIGFDCYATWCMYRGGTVFSDSLLGIKYILSDRQPSPAYKLIKNGVWENPYAFPTFFFANNDLSQANLENDPSSIVFQEDLLRRLGGNQNNVFYSRADVIPLNYSNLKKADFEDGAQKFTRINENKPGLADYLIETGNTAQYYMLMPRISLNYDVWLEDGSEIFYKNQSFSPFIVNLFGHDIEGSVAVHVDIGKQKAYLDQVLAWKFDLEAFSQIAEDTQMNAPSQKRTDNQTFELDFEPSAQERILYSSIPFDNGWQARIEGKPVEKKMIFDSLLAYKIPAGAEKMIVTFTPRGMKFGASVSLISAMIILIALISGKWNFRKKSRQTRSL